MSKLLFELPTLPYFTECCWYEAFFTPEEIEFINNHYLHTEHFPASVTGSNQYQLELRKSKVASLTPGQDTEWFFQKVSQIALQTNIQYYGFEVHGMFEPIQIAEYSIGDFFNWHLDFGAREASNRKLSVVVQLTSPETYEGGDLQYMVNEKACQAPRTLGTVIIFPSFIQHRVTPITKGIRRSATTWVSGPPYK